MSLQTDPEVLDFWDGSFIAIHNINQVRVTHKDNRHIVIIDTQNNKFQVGFSNRESASDYVWKVRGAVVKYWRECASTKQITPMT